MDDFSIMDQLLTPIHTTLRAKSDESGADLLRVSEPSAKQQKSPLVLTSPEDVLDALRSKPDFDTLSKILRWLESPSPGNGEFNIRKPSPKAAQIVFVLVNLILPNYWTVLTDEGTGNSKTRRLLLHYLGGIAGVGAVISSLRSLLDQSKDSRSQNGLKSKGSTHFIEMLLNVLDGILRHDNYIASLWKDIHTFSHTSPQVSLQWKEVVSLFASGKLLSIASEASHVVNELSPDIRAGTWIANGKDYATWLGRNILNMVSTLKKGQQDGRKAASQMLGKAMTIGYTDQVVEAANAPLISGFSPSSSLMLDLSAREQKAFLFSLIRILSRRYLDIEERGPNDAIAKKSIPKVNSVAALIASLVKSAPSLQDHLVDWLVGISADSVGHSSATHRAVITVLSQDEGYIDTALGKALELFSDKLFIKHSPIMHQEVNTQILLILAGFLYRDDKARLLNVSKSSRYLNAISDHLAASSPRAHSLGMFVGTAVSELVDPKDKRLTFSAEITKSTDGKWYQSLTNVEDHLGSIQDLKPVQTLSILSSKKRVKPVTNNKNSRSPSMPAQASSKIISIEEISDSSESEVDDLPIYQKPDSDPSDDDDDPTLVQRNKPTAPVYIRDLLEGLKDTVNFDRHYLALKNAAPLIRRKAGFGTEVSDHVEELATRLVGLGDTWEIDDFQKLRLQGMVAVLVAEPLRMGQWFSKTFYNGEYSLSQRASILTILGLGARELAGLGKEDAEMTANSSSENAFPSKRLPDKLHKLYALEAAPVAVLSNQLEKALIQPLAAEAADKITGPNILKVRTFSSRMEVEKKRQKPITNALAKLVAEGFFFPLTGRWRIQLQAHGENTPQASPHLLPHFLKTLSLILHASGSSTLSLPQMTTEFWDLLLSLRPRATEFPVLEALLFSFLTLLDINANGTDDGRRLAEVHAKELLETQGWVEGVFERLGGGSEEGERLRMLAAGVLVRTREVVGRYQRVLMGDLAEYM